MSIAGYRVPARKKILGTDGYRVPARKKIFGTDGYRVPARKKFLGTDGYRVPARKTHADPWICQRVIIVNVRVIFYLNYEIIIFKIHHKSSRKQIFLLYIQNPFDCNLGILIIFDFFRLFRKSKHLSREIRHILKTILLQNRMNSRRSDSE